MKKLLTIMLSMVLRIGIASASTFSNAVKSTGNAVKSDVKSTANSVKNAAKTDLQNKQAKKTSKVQQKREAKIKKLDNKLAKLNKKMNNVKNDKTITETERVIKMKKIQSEINVVKQEKAALQ